MSDSLLARSGRGAAGMAGDADSGASAALRTGGGDHGAGDAGDSPRGRLLRGRGSRGSLRGWLALAGRRGIVHRRPAPDLRLAVGDRLFPAAPQRPASSGAAHGAGGVRRLHRPSAGDRRARAGDARGTSAGRAQVDCVLTGGVAGSFGLAALLPASARSLGSSAPARAPPRRCRAPFDRWRLDRDSGARSSPVTRASPDRCQAGERRTENLAHAKSPFRSSSSKRSSTRRGSSGAPPPSVTGATDTMTSSRSPAWAN